MCNETICEKILKDYLWKLSSLKAQKNFGKIATKKNKVGGSRLKAQQTLSAGQRGELKPKAIT